MAKTEPKATAGMRPARRTIVKGAAWAVPVVTVASAAPAMAASPGPVTPSYMPGTFCKHPSDNAYHAVFCFNNPTLEVVTVVFTDFTVAGATRQGAIEPGSVDVPAEGSKCFYVDGLKFTSMPEANVTLSFKYTVDGVEYTGSISTNESANHMATPCGTSPRTCQPKGKPPHGNYEECEEPGKASEEPAAETDAEETVEEHAVKTDAPTADEPAAEEPAVEAPATEEPAVEEPTVDTAEVTSAPDTASSDEATDNN